MMDLIQKLAGMLQGGGSNHHAPDAIAPAGNPAVPMGMTPGQLAQYGGNYAAGKPMGETPGISPQATPGIADGMPGIAGGPASMPGPKDDAGTIPVGNKWIDMLRGGLAGAKQGLDSQRQQPVQAPTWMPMQNAGNQGMIMPANRPTYGKRY